MKRNSSTDTKMIISTLSIKTCTVKCISFQVHYVSVKGYTLGKIPMSFEIEFFSNIDFSLYLFNTFISVGCPVNFYKVVFIQYCNLYYTISLSG